MPRKTSKQQMQSMVDTANASLMDSLRKRFAEQTPEQQVIQQRVDNYKRVKGSPEDLELNEKGAQAMLANKRAEAAGQVQRGTEDVDFLNSMAAFEKDPTKQADIQQQIQSKQNLLRRYGAGQ